MALGHQPIHNSLKSVYLRVIETAWVILNSARALAGYPTLSMIASLSTAPKPSQ